MIFPALKNAGLYQQEEDGKHRRRGLRSSVGSAMIRGAQAQAAWILGFCRAIHPLFVRLLVYNWACS
jgi:hypothetical protein